MNTTLVTTTKNIPCPHCKSENVAVISYSDTVDFRNMELDVENLQMSKCNNCGHKWTTAEQHAHNNSIMRSAYVVERDQLRTKHGLLTGQEIAQMRERFGINQREAAAIFGGGYNAFNKYESGEVLQSFAMDRLVRLASVVGMPAIEFLRNVFSAPNFIVISATQGTIAKITVQIKDIDFISNLALGTLPQLGNLELAPIVNWHQSSNVLQQPAIHNHP
jgi:putative zinc finger/helix-turn-helix YgiT family protein